MYKETFFSCSFALPLLEHLAYPSQTSSIAISAMLMCAKTRPDLMANCKVGHPSRPKGRGGSWPWGGGLQGREMFSHHAGGDPASPLRDGTGAMVEAARGGMARWGRSSESRRTVAPSRSVRQRIQGEQIVGAKDPREQFRPARVGWRRYLEKRMEVRRRGAAAPSRRTRIEIIGEIGRAKASFDRILNFVKSVESDMYLRMEGVVDSD